MNNRKLTKFINLYGGNDDINEYTSSLLDKYITPFNKVDNIIKIKNLDILLYDSDSDSDKIELNFIKTISGGRANNIIKIDNIDDIKYSESATFTEVVSRINNIN